MRIEKIEVAATTTSSCQSSVVGFCVVGKVSFRKFLGGGARAFQEGGKCPPQNETMVGYRPPRGNIQRLRRKKNEKLDAHRRSQE